MPQEVYAMMIACAVCVVAVVIVSLANNKLQRERNALDVECEKLAQEVAEADVARTQAICEAATRICEIEEQRDASQASLDTLGAELLKVRADRDATRGRLSVLVIRTKQLGEDLQEIYAKLKLTEPEESQ